MGANLTGQYSETIPEIVRKLTGKRTPHRYDADVARGLVAITYAIQKSGLGVEDFGRRYVETGDSASGLIHKWRRADTVPSLAKIERIDSEIPGTLELYLHPFFALLADRPLSVKDVRRLLRPFQGRGSLGCVWSFPDDAERLAERTYVPVMVRDDTRALRLRGDLHGAAVILGLVREAEALGRTADHLRYIADLYRCLPSLASAPWLRRHRQWICVCIQSIHFRHPLSFELLPVRWDLIRKLSSAAIREKMESPLFRETFWRFAERDGFDVVEPVPLGVPPIIRHPLRKRRGRR